MKTVAKPFSSVFTRVDCVENFKFDLRLEGSTDVVAELNVTLHSQPRNLVTPFAPASAFDAPFDETLLGGGLSASVRGLDRPGFLRYMTALYKKFDVNVEGAFGRRLNLLQASDFEFLHTHENLEKVRAMLDDLVRGNVPDFTVLPVAAPDRVFELKVKFAEDASGLLFPVADFLADNSVNLKMFSAEKDPFGALLGRPAVFADAVLEVPPVLNNRDLYYGLLETTGGAEVTLTERVRLGDNGKPMAVSVRLSNVSGR
ncbi:MAG: hypothetical protein FJ304_24795 [Planctomycetes bacterium]|nr:hypothetical protein [Planctomycetota bacterium]